jgi:hypothetical protein
MEDHPMATTQTVGTAPAQLAAKMKATRDRFMRASRQWKLLLRAIDAAFPGVMTEPERNLIAAAPDMLAALRETQKMLAHMTSKEYQLGGDAPVRRKIDAILARVDGA